ncbi:murein L,D-transpeptidase catalytic domain family protein [Flavobacterium rakeshii]|nr:murein L,D-transpeptidase catalytic domain family protein [Flavobacterium rakeshii]
MKMIYNFFTSILFLLSAVNSPVTITTNTKTVSETKAAPLVAEATTVATASGVYSQLDANSLSLPDYESFERAFEGYVLLKEQGKIKKDLLTLVDFSKSSNTKRLWIIDMSTKTVLYNTLVAHGRNSGNEFATAFSNAANSNKSSLGFYATGEVYIGKHGTSLRLDGLEKGINSNARSRAVVIHGADYVSEGFIKQHKRLGRSLGCPALPNRISKEVIDLIKGKSCLFIYHPSKNYVSTSKLVS